MKLLPVVNPLGDILSGTKHDESLDADDSVVHRLSFLILLYFDERF